MANRPKGFAAWSPTPEVLVVLDQVQQILREYSDYLPLTVRQIFYRLVGAFGYEKTERAYKRLSNYLVRARRARLIRFDHIRDDGTIWYPCHGYSKSQYVRVQACESPDHYQQELRQSADAYRRERMASQDLRIEVWCEAGGMAPQLTRVCDPYGIEVYSTGGFSSVTVTHEIATRATINYDKPTYLLHIGDYDPSGVSLYEAMVEDAMKFTWGLVYKGERSPGLHGVRVALLAEQIEEHDIPTAPPKPTDTRSVNWYGETAQAEAMPPDLLASTLDDAIREHIDVDLYEELLAEEESERDDLRGKLEALDWDA